MSLKASYTQTFNCGSHIVGNFVRNDKEQLVYILKKHPNKQYADHFYVHALVCNGCATSIVFGKDYH